LSVKKKQIIEHLAGGVGYRTLMKVREIMQIAAGELINRRNIMVKKYLLHFSQKRVKRKFINTVRKQGPDYITRGKRILKK
jgi:hypothetical protein